MMPLQCLCWLNIITTEKEVFNRIKQRQWNYMLGQQTLAIVRRIVTWLAIIMRGDLKKAKFHFEAAAMAGHDVARYNIGCLEYNSGNMDRAVKHWTIAASAGDYHAMHTLRKNFEGGFVSRESIDSTLIAYNNSCAEMRSEASDTYIRVMTAMETSLM
jgi:hypothetical protein